LHPHSEYIFVGRNGKTFISDNTINTALKRLGYGGKQTAHGLRATAYNRTKFLDNRREMMQEWADYLESLLV